MSTHTLIACALVLAWMVLIWHVWLAPKCRAARRKTHRAAGYTAAPRIQGMAPADSIAVIYASQSGTAAELAQRTARSLGASTAAYPLSDFSPQSLGELRTALFIVSTCDEGDPPDSARAFAQAARAWPAHGHLAHLRFGLLALGDRTYTHFCGYGRTLNAWLRQHGASPLFEPVWVDRQESAALHRWQTLLTQHLHARAWQAPTLTPWRLAARRCLNPGSPGAPCHELLLHCANAHPPVWQAGDIAQVCLGTSGQTRDYSIASTPEEGYLRLLVRQYHHADGAPGLGSRYLGSTLTTGAEVRIHLRSNPQFHLMADHRPAIFVGAGTGLAGLRALISARAALGQNHSWLVFGERTCRHDFFWQDVLEAWLADGTLARMDLAFSRDRAEKRYVQHCLRDAATELRDWIARGAVVYLCGSRAMGQDVDLALRDILGEHGIRDLIGRGGYRRDVY